MIWKLEALQDNEMPQACINGKWVSCRPENGKRKHATFMARLRAAWEVFMCRAEAFTWPEGQ